MDRLVNVLNDDAGLNLGHVADRGFLNDLGRKYHQQSPVLAKRGSQNRGQKRISSTGLAYLEAFNKTLNDFLNGYQPNHFNNPIHCLVNNLNIAVWSEFWHRVGARICNPLEVMSTSLGYVSPGEGSLRNHLSPRLIWGIWPSFCLSRQVRGPDLCGIAVANLRVVGNLRITVPLLTIDNLHPANVNVRQYQTYGSASKVMTEQRLVCICFGICNTKLFLKEEVDPLFPVIIIILKIEYWFFIKIPLFPSHQGAPQSVDRGIILSAGIE